MPLRIKLEVGDSRPEIEQRLISCIGPRKIRRRAKRKQRQMEMDREQVRERVEYIDVFKYTLFTTNYE